MIRLRILFLFCYIISFFVLLGFGNLAFLNGAYFPFTLLMLATMILTYKIRLKNMSPKDERLPRLKDEQQNVEIFTAIIAILFSVFKLVEYCINYFCNK